MEQGGSCAWRTVTRPGVRAPRCTPTSWGARPLTQPGFLASGSSSPSANPSATSRRRDKAGEGSGSLAEGHRSLPSRCEPPAPASSPSGRGFAWGPPVVHSACAGCLVLVPSWHVAEPRLPGTAGPASEDARTPGRGLCLSVAVAVFLGELQELLWSPPKMRGPGTQTPSKTGVQGGWVHVPQIKVIIEMVPGAAQSTL